MRKKRLILIVTSIGLVLALVLSGCAAQEAPEPEIVEKIVEKTVTETVEVEDEYRCLSPRGIALPVETLPLSERLDTIDGKTIYIRQGEADPVIMPALYEYAKENYPGTEWVYHEPTSGFGPNTPGDEEVENADALIRGIGW